MVIYNIQEKSIVVQFIRKKEINIFLISIIKIKSRILTFYFKKLIDFSIYKFFFKKSD